MTWAERRKFFYALVLLIIVGGIALLAYRNITNVPVSCINHKQDQGEVGVDCGGPCSNYCPFQLNQPKVLWVRSFQVTPGIVHAVAYIQHNNANAAARNMQYEFKIYDDKNNVIATRDGSTFVGTAGNTAIVEALIPVGTSTPAVTRFAITGAVPWEKIPSAFSVVTIKSDRTLLETTGQGRAIGTRLTATLENQNRYNFTNLDVVAILYDEQDNAIAVSKSLLPTLLGQSTQTLYFTWPFAMPTKVARIEILPRFNPFTTTAL